MQHLSSLRSTKLLLPMVRRPARLRASDSATCGAHNDESDGIPARHMQEAHRLAFAELSPCRYQLSEPVPCNRTGDSHLQRGSVTAGLKQRSSQRGEGTDRIRECGFRAGNCFVMLALRFPPVFPTILSWVSTMASAIAASHSTTQTARIAQRRSEVMSRKPSVK